MRPIAIHVVRRTKAYCVWNHDLYCQTHLTSYFSVCKIWKVVNSYVPACNQHLRSLQYHCLRLKCCRVPENRGLQQNPSPKHADNTAQPFSPSGGLFGNLWWRDGFLRQNHVIYHDMSWHVMIFHMSPTYSERQGINTEMGWAWHTTI